MKIILILAPFVIGLLAAIATVAIGGMFMSRTHKASRSIMLAAAPEQVWAVITDYPSHPTWRNLKSIERGPDLNGHPVWREIDKRGEVMPIELIEITAPRRLVGRIADPNLPFGGTWTWDLTPEGTGTRVRITEDGEIKPPPFRYIARIIGYDMTINQYLKALAAKFNQPAQPEA
jgi:uncharacterized protein YndB with AHSA1/START domain